MKTLLLIAAVMLSLPGFAANNVIACKLGPKQKINITVDNNKYFYSLNGSKPTRLASAKTIQSGEFKNESMILELISYLRIPSSQILRANMYQLSDDADGGQTVFRFWVAQDKYIAGYISMGGVKICQ